MTILFKIYFNFSAVKMVSLIERDQFVSSHGLVKAFCTVLNILPVLKQI